MHCLTGLDRRGNTEGQGVLILCSKSLGINVLILVLERRLELSFGEKGDSGIDLGLNAKSEGIRVALRESSGRALDYRVRKENYLVYVQGVRDCDFLDSVSGDAPMDELVSWACCFSMTLTVAESSACQYCRRIGNR